MEHIDEALLGLDQNARILACLEILRRYTGKLSTEGVKIIEGGLKWPEG
jgi:hypothetical protein